MHAFLVWASITIAATMLILLLVWSISVALRRARRRPNRFTSVGWALLFLTGGRMPPPPPQTQIEHELETRKNREAGEDR